MITENMSRVDWALYLASLGGLIFPTRPGDKRPMGKKLDGKGWKDIMTRDPDQIRAWFIDNPDINYGVCGGDRFFIVDLDTKGIVNGVDSFSNLQGDQPLTEWVNESLSVDTPSGGVHIYLATPFPISNAHNFGDGIDVRGAGGYVIGPGCELIKGLCKDTDIPGEYSVKNVTDIKLAPQWVMHRVSSERKRDDDATKPLFELDLPEMVKRARDWIKHRAPAIEGSGGNAHTYATAVMVKDFGISEQMCLEILIEPNMANGQSWNETCDPPWDLKGDVGSLQETIRNAYRYGTDRPGSKGGGVMEMDDALPDGVYGEETMEEDAFADLETITFPGESIFKRNKKRNMIISEWIPAHGFIGFLANRGMGKTVTMLDMALSISCDLQWQGLQTQEKWAAVYICGEDDEGAEQMMKAWCLDHEMKLDPDRFIILAGMVDLMSATDTEKWTKFLKKKLKGRPAIVFIDTWQRGTSRGAQNSDEDMQLCVHHIESMAKSLLGPAVVAFHPPKDGRNTILGTSVIENSSVAILLLTETAQGKHLEIIRMKGKGEGNYRLFRFKEVIIEGDFDQFGNKITGITLEKIGGTEDIASGKAVKDYDRGRTAWAETIREIIREDTAMSFEQSVYSKDGEYGLNKMINKIEEICKVTDKKDEFANRIKFFLSDFSNFSPSSIRAELTRFFTTGQLPYIFPDDCHLICGKAKSGGGKAFKMSI